MKRKLFLSLLSLWVLAISSPSWAFACATPCRMTQKQMMDCARACSKGEGGLSIRRADCVKLQVQAAPVFTMAATVSLAAPAAQACLQASLATVAPLFKPRACALRGPPLSPPQLQLASLPRANAPPQLN